MSPKVKRARVQRQSGVALFVVLILLAVLAGATVLLIQNQRWAVRQMADRLDVLDQVAASSAAHDQCVAPMRSHVLDGLGSALAGYVGDHAPNNANEECVYEWFNLPAESGADWAPNVRVTSQVLVKGIWMREVSEWAYPKCTDATGVGCLRSEGIRVMNSSGAVVRTVNAVFSKTGDVFTARRPVL